MVCSVMMSENNDDFRHPTFDMHSDCHRQLYPGRHVLDNEFFQFQFFVIFIGLIVFFKTYFTTSEPATLPKKKMDLAVTNVKPAENRTGVLKLRQLLNKTLRIEMSDGRVLIGIFLCTDADANVILGSCSEYLPQEFRLNKAKEEPRMLGLVMVPGKHIVTVSKDTNDPVSIHNNSPSIEVQDVI